MSKDIKYNAILLELSKECEQLMKKYAPILHSAYHADNKGVKLSHVDLVREIQQDCIRICTDHAMKITFRGAGEEELIGEILDYNYDEADVEHMIKVEKISLFSHLRTLNKSQNGKVNPGPLGSRRTQFCKCCGDQIYISRT
jgi:hypothetical protein